MKSVQSNTSTTVHNKREYPLAQGDEFLSRKLVCIAELGHGTTATVYRARTQTGEEVAVKMYLSGDSPMQYFRNETKILNILREKAALQNITPPIVPFIDVDVTVRFDPTTHKPHVHPAVIFTAGGISLSSFMRGYEKQHGTSLPLRWVLDVAEQLSRALAFIHAAGVIHADVKASNILLMDRDPAEDGQLRICLADFGMSTVADKIFSKRVGTPEYCAPELALGRTYDAACDTWSFGCAVFRALTGDCIFDVDASDCVQYGSDVDTEAVPEESFHHSADSDAPPSEGEKQFIYRHFMLITKLIGPPPNEFCKRAKGYFTNRGQLVDHPNIQPITVRELCEKNYELAQISIDMMVMVAKGCFAWMPARRCTMANMNAMINAFIENGKSTI